MRSEDIAWAAGLFEGEGCFSFEKRYGVCRMVVGSTDLDVLDRFKNILGVGSITKDKERPNRKQSWRWQTSNREDFDYASELLRPWLCVRRTSRLDEIINLRADRKQAAKNSPLCVKGHERTWLGTRWVCRPCRAEAQYKYMQDPNRKEKAKEYLKDYYQKSKTPSSSISSSQLNLDWIPKTIQ